jgi:hypothetical protein
VHAPTLSPDGKKGKRGPRAAHGERRLVAHDGDADRLGVLSELLDEKFNVFALDGGRYSKAGAPAGARVPAIRAIPSIAGASARASTAAASREPSAAAGPVTQAARTISIGAALANPTRARRRRERSSARRRPARIRTTANEAGRGAAASVLRAREARETSTGSLVSVIGIPPFRDAL